MAATDAGISAIRNIALVGHEGSGKTTLVESFLKEAGVIQKMGHVKQKNTTSDYDPDEKEAGHSFNCSTISFSYNGVNFNLLDLPGSADSIGDVLAALRVVGCALICVDALHGVKINTLKVWHEAERLGLTRIIVITRLDAENVDFAKTLKEIRNHFGERCIPLVLPDGSGESFKSLTNSYHTGSDASGEVASVHTELIEDIVEADEKLMGKYLEGSELADEEVKDAFQKSMIDGTIHPVLTVAAEKGIGTKEALDILAEISPPPGLIQRKAVKGGEEIVLDGSGGLVGFVYRTVSDEFVTRISYMRILSGKLQAQSGFVNRRSGKTEKISGVYKVCGKELKSVPEAGAGDIVAVTKVEDIMAGDTITDDKTDVTVEGITYPVPMVSLAVKPKSRGDEQKIGSALKEMEEDDKTFKVVHDEQTAELVISGMSDHHLSLMLKRLKRRRKVEVDTSTPKIPYRETITGKVERAEYQHKKQSGGAGQYAKVFLNIEPKKRGEGYEFIDKIVGGVIDGPLKPSVDKGIQTKMKEGVIAGYPVVDVCVTLVDGKMHPVDSKDIAFQIAGREAFKLGFLQCNPVILEPIVKMDVVVHQEKMGDIIGDINSRRGKILSSNVRGDMEILEAQAPLAEVQHYQADLQSITGGEGSYTMQLSHYDPVPPQIQKSLVEGHEKADA